MLNINNLCELAGNVCKRAVEPHFYNSLVPMVDVTSKAFSHGTPYEEPNQQNVNEI